MHAIIRTKKHKSISSLKFREKHTYREHPTPNADPEKINRNKLLFGQKNYAEGLENFLEDYKKENHIRKDGVLTVKYLLTASPEFFSEGPKNERDARLKNWCGAQIDFMKKEHGEKNILCMYLHLDEKTPHIECYVVPIDPKGKLNCKHFLGGKSKLQVLQTWYATHNDNFGLERGLKGSRATHQQVQKFYDQIQGKAKVTSENLQKAVKLEPPTIKNIFDPDAYLKIQEAKIFTRVAKLFASTVYENKLIQQAKKILRDFKAFEENNQKLIYKIESEKESLTDKLQRQIKAVSMLNDLQIENKELKEHLQDAQIENQFLKTKLSPKPIGP